ncbi:MAG TPA: hypothetical protein PLI51_11440 [bacterium]|nr:hypothetical protein [bacterium]
MLGLEAPSIWLAYLLSILAALLCVGYGIAAWNRGAKTETPDEEPEVREWVKEEKEIEEEL